jgi:hypothetical protein
MYSIVVAQDLEFKEIILLKMKLMIHSKSNNTGSKERVVIQILRTYNFSSFVLEGIQ